MMAQCKFTTEQISNIRYWNSHLLSFKTTKAANFSFIAGQFCRLGIETTTEILWRPYSIVSACTATELEFYSVILADGKFSQSLTNMSAGSPLYIDKTSYGFLTLERFVGGEDLWLLATGTGIAPFIAMLHEVALWAQFKRVILVHCVRTAADLSYQAEIADIAHNIALNQLQYVQVITRDNRGGHLYQRIPALLINGTLEQHVGLKITIAHSRVMLCGAPEMVASTRQILAERGLSLSRRGQPGNFAVENSW
jgi:ferredoxin/flavodoxin---NADP+ reductase